MSAAPMPHRSRPMRNWILPEYIEDLLPAEAGRLEAMRRAVLDLLRVHGYELVMPPLVEYLESLLSGSGGDMALSTFKLVDQLSGRTMGLRADITPQVARIDAHLLNRRGVTRLCYAGPVAHTLPSGLYATREPFQVGAELYGHGGIESDVEIQELMLKSLAAAGVQRVQLDIGHVGVFRALTAGLGIDAAMEADLFNALRGKDVPALRELVRALPAGSGDALLRLADLYGGAEILAEARRVLPDSVAVREALDALEAMAERLLPAVGGLCFDLAELRGYHYHSGVVFAAYAEGCPNGVARGGRYDEVGKAFGRARPATGFSMDLREVLRLAPPGAAAGRILAPWSDDAGLRLRVEALRGAGEVVVAELPGHGVPAVEAGCDRRLARIDGEWRVVPLT